MAAFYSGKGVWGRRGVELLIEEKEESRSPLPVGLLQQDAGVHTGACACICESEGGCLWRREKEGYARREHKRGTSLFISIRHNSIKK